MARPSKKLPRTATHRPAVKRRRFRHDDLVAVDLFTGFGKKCGRKRVAA